MMRNRFFVTLLVALLSAGLLMTSLSGCGKSDNSPAPAEPTEPAATAEPETPAEPYTAAETDAAAEAETTPEPETSAPETEAPETETTVRQDGERFDDVIILEGMEETVHYEHIRNEAIGFEMDYDYELLQRQSESDRERFVSVYDDPENPENYFEVTYRSEDAETVADSIVETLSQDYTVERKSDTLERAGACICIDASSELDDRYMAEQPQLVYVIPTDEGCLVVNEHYYIVETEGMGHRFAYMMNTLAVIPAQTASAAPTQGEGSITQEQALSAIKNYCYRSNPDLKSMEENGEHSVDWSVASSNETQIVILFHSYTGAEVRYYVDPSTGETYVTQFVSGITPEEERTDERFNVRDYMN